MIGKTIRTERILNRETGRTVIVPMDHGLTIGPVPGLEDLSATIDKIVSGGASAILMHKGMVEHGHRGGGEDVGLVVHMSASTTLSTQPNFKVQSCEVKEAIKLGADAVSIHVNLGAEQESEMLSKFGAVAQDCQEWGLPLVAMMYTRGPKIDDPYDSKIVAHAARVGAELGADVVKCNYTGDPASFEDVVEGCPVPVVIAGGEKTESRREVLSMVDDSVEAGGCGISIGRNVFQAERPEKMVEALSKIVHDRISLDEAEAILDE
jgi:predicted phospho-2-dehydro-3-deoxyheptonate aldolase